MTIAVLTACPILAAADQTTRFDIESQPLADALLQFSERSGIKVFFSSETVEQIDAGPLKGRYTPEEALRILLSPSNLQYRFTQPDTVIVSGGRARAFTGADLLAMNPMENFMYAAANIETKGSDEPVEQEHLLVRGAPIGGYNVLNSSTATMTDTPILETPFSIKVVPQEVLRDQQVINIFDSLRNVAGVVAWGASQNVADSFISRGFTNHRGVYRDGFQYYDIVSCCPTGFRETANVERMEFLKGPASILFGRVEPGGVLNLVTKQPLATPYYSLQQQFGSYDYYRTTIDATGPLTSDDTLLYRFNLAYQNAGSFREFVTNDRVFVAPKLRWNISPRTQVLFELEYMHNKDTPDLGNVPIMLAPTGNKPSPLPRDRNIGEQWSTLEGDRILVGLDWSHQFNDNWTLHNRFNMERFDYVFIGVFASPAAPDGTVRRGFFDVDPQKADRYYTVLDLTGRFETWGAKHTLVVGGNYFRADELHFERFSPPGGQLADTNIFHPIHQPVQPPGNPIDQSDVTTQWYGLFLQDQIELPYNIHLLGGFRYDNAEIQDNLNNGRVVNEDDRTSPRGGVVWNPVPWLSLYGSYTENFGASNGQLAVDGTFLPSETAQQWEAGFKTEFRDGRLTATFAWFDLTKQNIRSADPNNPLRALVVGEAESKGIELDLTGEILPGWNVIANYAYTPFAEITQGTSRSVPKVGSRFQGAPRHLGNFWTTYDFQDGSLSGLAFGAGVTAVSNRVGNNADTYSIPGYAIVNLMGRYAWDLGSTRVSAQVNLENLLDKTYALGTNGSNHIPFGAPRTVLGALRVEF